MWVRNELYYQKISMIALTTIRIANSHTAILAWAAKENKIKFCRVVFVLLMHSEDFYNINFYKISRKYEELLFDGFFFTCWMLVWNRSHRPQRFFLQVRRSSWTAKTCSDGHNLLFCSPIYIYICMLHNIVSCDDLLSDQSRGIEARKRLPPGRSQNGSGKSMVSSRDDCTCHRWD